MPQSNVLTLWTQKTSEAESSASAAAEHAAPGPDVTIKNEASASAAAEDAAAGTSVPINEERLW